MERFFMIDRFNTFVDWHLILTAKDVTPPQPKLKYIELEGVDGSLDLSEALTGTVSYRDRTVTASFWTDYGTHRDRSRLIRDIRCAVHGKKVRIIDPDDPDHYFLGRVIITAEKNIIPFAEISIECDCDPWRYSIRDSVRSVDATTKRSDIVITNTGVKTIVPEITVTNGPVNLHVNGSPIALQVGNYRNSDIVLKQGLNIFGLDGTGTITFTYKECDI